jgi:hypothetical protein
MEPSAPSPALSALERTRLADLLAVMPSGRWWAVAHMHGPLLCALGLLSTADPAYERAAQRHFRDPADTRRRALTLLDEFERDARDERYELRRRERRRSSRFGSFSRSTPPPDDDPANELPRSA